MCQLGADIGGRRGDDREISFFRQLDVFHFKFKITVKGVGQALIDRQGLKGQRCDKFQRIFGHNHVYIRVLFLQKAGKVRRLVCGDSAGYSQNNRFSS